MLLEILVLLLSILCLQAYLFLVDWSNYKNLSKEEEICVQLNAQAINTILSTLSAEVQDEAIFNGQPPPESAHLIWTKLVELYGKIQMR